MNNSGTKDLMNLLHSDSDSDTFELLNLPPLSKSKTKSKRRRNRMNNADVCSPWCLMKIVVILSLIAAVSVIGVMTYQLNRKVTDLQNKLEKFQAENNNQAIPTEIGSIKLQIQDWNKTLQVYRTGNRGLDEVIKNLTTLSQQVKGLQTVLTEIKNKNGDQHENSKSGGKTLAESVADLGSDLEALKKQHQKLEKTTNERIEHLENQLNLIIVPHSQPHPSDSVDTTSSTALASQLSLIQETLQNTNTSLYGEISLIKEELFNHEKRFSTFENEATKPAVTVNTTAIMTNLRDQLTTYIQSQMSNVSRSTGQPPEGVLDTIREEVENITLAVNSLQLQIGSEHVSDTTPTDNVKVVRALQLLHEHLNNTDATVRDLNNSLESVDKTVEKLMNLYIQEKNMMVNLTTHVDGIKRYLSRMTDNHDQSTTGESNVETTTSTPGDGETPEMSTKSTEDRSRRDTVMDEVEKLLG